MITCDEIEGPCCNSCHEDAQLGYYGSEMCSIYESNALNAPLFAHVCCRKGDAAYAMLASYQRMRGR